MSASTQNQALQAVLFLYRDVLNIGGGCGARRDPSEAAGDVPVVLGRAEVRAILGQLSGSIQTLLRHADVSTTMIYTHVLERGVLGVRSPADNL